MEHHRITKAVMASGAASALLLGIGAPAQAAPADSTAPAAGECQSGSGERALLLHGDRIADYVDPGTGQVLEPRLAEADTTHYDSCAELSWIEVPYGLGTPPPHGILLFHGEQYLGTTTTAPTPHGTEAQRLDDGALAVDYPVLDDRLNVVDTVRSTFTWDDETRSVIHEGEFPPGA